MDEEKKINRRWNSTQQTKQASGAKPPSAFGTLACLKLRRRLRFARGVMSLSGQRLAFVKRWRQCYPFERQEEIKRVAREIRRKNKLTLIEGGLRCD